MASLVNLLRRFRQDGPETFRECRRCGTIVDPEPEECPQCESAEIATYRIGR